MLRAALFDLDDTLYPQADYLRGAWRAVAQRATEWELDPDHFGQALETVSSEGSDRGQIIDRALARVDRTDVPLGPLVTAFRTFVPDALEAYPGVVERLTMLASHVPLAVVTDGWPPGQRAKLRALGLDGVFAVEVFSDDLGREHRKPNPLPFLTALARLGVPARDAIFVGDRPNKDVRGARGVGIQAIRVRTGEHAAEPCEYSGVITVPTAADAIERLLDRVARPALLCS